MKKHVCSAKIHLRASVGVLGIDHPDTLSSAYDLSSTLRLLGEFDLARQLDEDTQSRRLNWQSSSPVGLETRSPTTVEDRRSKREDTIIRAFAMAGYD
jgi:hypothetical protein